MKGESEMKLVIVRYKVKDRKDKTLGKVSPNDYIIQTAASATVEGTDKTVFLDESFSEITIREQDQMIQAILGTTKRTRTVLEIAGIEKYREKEQNNPAFEKYADLLKSLIKVQQITTPKIAEILGIEKIEAKSVVEELEVADIIVRTYSFWSLTKKSKASIRNFLLGTGKNKAVPILEEKPEERVRVNKYGSELMERYQQRIMREEPKIGLEGEELGIWREKRIAELMKEQHKEYDTKKKKK
jgi:hypothetical protein